jgi:hypothetical protein
MPSAAARSACSPAEGGDPAGLDAGLAAEEGDRAAEVGVAAPAEGVGDAAALPVAAGVVGENRIAEPGE